MRVTLFKTLFSALLLGFFLWHTPLLQVWLRLRELNAQTLVWLAVLANLTWLLSALRLWCLLPEFRLREVVRNTFTAIYYGTVLPGQLAGDVIKAYRLARSSTRRGHAEAATLVDRSLATFGLFVVSAGVGICSPRVPSWLRVFFIVGAIALVAGGALISSSAFRQLVERFLPERTDAVSRFLCHMGVALHDCLRRPKRLFIAFCLALVFHGLCVVNHVIVGHALHIELSWTDWTAIYASVSLIVLLPFSVAGIGLREGGYVGIMALFGINRESALSISFVMFGYLLLGTLIGLFAELDARRTISNPSSHLEKKPNCRP